MRIIYIVPPTSGPPLYSSHCGCNLTSHFICITYLSLSSPRLLWCQCVRCLLAFLIPTKLRSGRSKVYGATLDQFVAGNWQIHASASVPQVDNSEGYSTSLLKGINCQLLMTIIMLLNNLPQESIFLPSLVFPVSHSSHLE